MKDDDASNGASIEPSPGASIEPSAGASIEPLGRRALSASTVELAPRKRVEVGARDEPPPDSPFETGSERFEARGELGRGGMGRVDHVYDRALCRAVAIKRVLRASKADLARFAREARLTARLEHVGIVPIHDVGHDRDGTPYYVMRKVGGRSLAELVDAGVFAERLALIPSVVAACDAVAFAHAHGIVHRDLKPHNILIGPFGETLVIDWGLALEMERGDELTAADVAPGTPGFLAPEQARGEPVDRRADVFALGATLFYVLAGRPPHRAASATETIAAASGGQPADWRALPAGVPADLRAILVQALAIDPAQRYADAGELAADLRQFVTGNLVAARRYGALARLVRFVRRYRAIVAVAAVSAIVLGAGAVVSVRQIVSERDDATAARALAEAHQRDAVDIADRLRVARAQQLAMTDPVAAIAQLRRLDASSHSWRGAWLAAVAAWTRGIPSGFRAEHKLMWVQIAGDGRRAVSASSAGDIAVYDLAARTRRTVARIPGVTMCQWIAEHQVLCRDPDQQLAVVDTERGGRQPLAIRASAMISDRRSRAVVETPDRQIVEIGPDGRTRVLASDADLAGASPDLDELALWRGDELALWTPSRTLPIARVPGAAPAASMVELRDHAGAAILGDDVIHWHVEGDRVVVEPRWPRRGAFALALVNGHVYTAGPDELAIDGVVTHVDVHASWAQPTGGGLAIVDTTGRVVLVDGERWLPLGPYPAQLDQIERSRDSRFAVARSSADELLVWDLTALRPHALREPPALDDQGAWVGAHATAAMNAGYVAALSSRGELSVSDAETGDRVALPLAGAIGEALVAHGDTLVFAAGIGADRKPRFDELELAVPHEPTALRRWLRDVTNAVSSTGDGTTWPSP